MKRIMMFSLLSLASWAIAAEIDQINVENAREITYKITISHDDTYDTARWDQLVKNTFEVVKKAQSGQGGSADEMIRSLSQALEIVCLDTVKSIGINGEMKITIGEKADKVKKDDAVCPCISKYKGVCPCTTENNCCSSK